ncbi:MAG TPA: hypothetical protein GXX14_02350 [Clostridiaceae bacterium]|nr:hypothetical protein [Clostridiaceae bacterium]
MLSAMLPRLEKKTLAFPYFPTIQQLIVWRNWGLVPAERIAEVLQTNKENIIEMAQDMGLKVDERVDENWLKRGYITIIRANWHLLSYRQLLALLGWSAEKLASVLKEDDFLSVKLGGFKPDVDEVVYAPLNEEQKKRTLEIRKIIEKHFAHAKDEKTHDIPFGFLKEFELKAPEFKRSGEAEPDEVVLNEEWCVRHPGNGKNIDTFIKRFVSNHEKRWGIKLRFSDRENRDKNIFFEIKHDNNKLSESHTIEITDRAIYIKAVDETGLLRGLQWMEKAMDERGGPFLKKGLVNRETCFDTRIIHAYCAVFGDPLMETEMDIYPEGLLAKLSELGINGIWLHGVLYTLVPWDEAPELSIGWETRIHRLKDLTKKAAQYGIGVYLYLNEPRAMPQKFFEKHPGWKGHSEGDYAALCTSVKPVQDFLKNSVRKLLEQVPDLAGIITITMSENLTNCYSRTFDQTTTCPRCSSREPHEVVAEVNRLIAEGAHSVKKDAKIICWTWGWQNTCGRERLWIKDAVGLLPENVTVMCTSEEAIETNIAGVKGSVLDYSMSIPGPGKRALDVWDSAAKKGLMTMAKVQFNNTWECSAVPYISVPGLVAQHLENLLNAGVTGLMLGWSLGGYPSINLDLASQFYWKQNNSSEIDLLEMAERKFGSKACKIVKEAWECFGNAFKEFPFDVMVLYTGPQNVGPKNLLYEKPTGFKATMVGFPYDDLETWRGIYPEEIFEEQFKKLSEKWKRGLDKLAEAECFIECKNQHEFGDLKNISEAVYCHFRSTYLQIKFVRLRDSLNISAVAGKYVEIKKEIINIINEEIKLAKKLYRIVSLDSRVGYEASNHYFYTLQDLIEKVICCEYLRNEFLN